jgi:hypothetical protein
MTDFGITRLKLKDLKQQCQFGLVSWLVIFFIKLAKKMCGAWEVRVPVRCCDMCGQCSGSVLHPGRVALLCSVP